MYVCKYVFMQNIRTTVLLPADLVVRAKIYAAQNQSSVSHLIRTSLQDTLSRTSAQPKKSLLEQAGSLDLGKKQPPTRSELYEKHTNKILGN